MKTFDVTLVLSPDLYANGDVLVVPQEIDGVFANGPAQLVSIVVDDEDDGGGAFDLLFLNADATVGTLNEPVTISDADSRKLLGAVSIGTGDYIDLVNSKLATIRNVGLVLSPASAQYSLWVAAVARGTGTWTTSGIRLKLGFA